ncbi:MAG: hypothetical protein KGL35_30530 [Bradyrhizobium sp.]|nr:hypothetical protein [Bradyrhizobium sp.]
MTAPQIAQRQRTSVAYGWMIRLAMVLPNSLTESEVSARCAAFADQLEQDFPPAAFTRESLHHVASEARFWPSYAELRTWLSAWWRDNRPALQALPAPETDLPPDQRCTPEQAAEILEKYGWSRSPSGYWTNPGLKTGTISAPPAPLPDVSVRGEALQQLRQRHGYAIGALAQQAVQRAADRATG